MMTIAKENLGLVLASVFFFAVIFYASFSGIYSGDLYWHLKVGEDFLFNGLNPFVDHYSVDFVGKKFLNYTLIFDSLAAVFYSLAGGEQGLQIMRLCLLSLPFFFLMIIGYKRKMNHLDLIWALSLIVACLTFRKLIRPELCSYGLTMMFALALFRKNLGFRSLIFLMLVQWSWQFVHSTAVFGYVLLAGIY